MKEYEVWTLTRKTNNNRYAHINLPDTKENEKLEGPMEFEEASKRVTELNKNNKKEIWKATGVEKVSYFLKRMHPNRSVTVTQGIKAKKSVTKQIGNMLSIFPAKEETACLEAKTPY